MIKYFQELLLTLRSTDESLKELRLEVLSLRDALKAITYTGDKVSVIKTAKQALQKEKGND